MILRMLFGQTAEFFIRLNQVRALQPKMFDEIQIAASAA